MSLSAAGDALPVTPVKRKRESIDSVDSPETDLSSIFDSPQSRVDEPVSPFSDVPDDLSDSAEARMDSLIPRTARHNIRRVGTRLQPQRPQQTVQPQRCPTQHLIQCRRKVPARKAKANATNVKANAQKEANSAKRLARTAPNDKLFKAEPTTRAKRKIEAKPKVATPPPLQAATEDEDAPTRPEKRSKVVVLKYSIPSKIVVLKLPTPSPLPEAAEVSVTASEDERLATLAAPVSATASEDERLYTLTGPVSATASEDVRLSILPAPASATASEYARLHTLATRLIPLASSNAAKPEPTGKPEVWAVGRQDLCETLHYFRSYHGGCYATGGFVKGFMFDKAAHCRDYMDVNVVISRAGGGLVQDKEAGQHVMSKDQRESSAVASLRNNMQYYNPVVITTGEDNPCMPSKPPRPYCVLDYFKPTHIWWEKTGGKKLLRYRFEKLNPKTRSWWTPKDVEQPVQLGELPPPVTQECMGCKAESQQVYLNGWMCLQPTCTHFWKLPDCDAEPPEDQLLYDPRFLKQRTVWPNDEHNYSLGSNTVELSGLSIVGEDRSLASWLGMVCPDCGRCNLRLSWSGWECFNASCTFKKIPPITFIPAKALRDPYFPLTNEYTISRDTHGPHIQVSVSFAHNYRINHYTIPGLDGFVAHMIANKTVVEEPGGPDDMFEELQRFDIGLRRRPLGSGMMKGESYTRHFAVNYGMPYKFIAATASESFDGAARAITDTRSRLNWASRFMVKDQHLEFNEVLALGYFEQQKINYHDDGEFGLGPTIATLSLGAPGTMRLRMKARHHNGVSNADVYDDAPPLPGCVAYEARLDLVDELRQLKASDTKAYRARLKELPTQLGLTAKGKAKDAITLTLGHGDIAIMHGAGIQKYYEHAVEHAGKLRFALTCRYIDPESLKEEDKPKYEVAPDEVGYDGSKLSAH